MSSPSTRARDLVRGGFDVHVHVAPDVVERKIDDVSLARRFAEHGLAGFVLKSHYTSTAERARVVAGVVPATVALGAIALNRAVGGLNALAVEVAAREGARVVWLPTVDAVSEAAAKDEVEPGVTPPVWVQLQRELRDRGLPMEPVPVVSADGALLPETHAVLERVAEHGLALATGHLGAVEAAAVVDGARAAGIADVVVTHPDYPAQSIPVADLVELADRGGLIERCFTTPHTGKVAWDRWLEITRVVGAERCVLASDLGQTANPPVEDGLALLADRLLDAGFTDEEVHTMAVTNTRRVAGAVG